MTPADLKNLLQQRKASGLTQPPLYLAPSLVENSEFLDECIALGLSLTFEDENVVVELSNG